MTYQIFRDFLSKIGIDLKDSRHYD